MKINSELFLPMTTFIIFSSSLLLIGCDNKDLHHASQQLAPEVGVVTLKSAPLKITTDLPGRISSFRIAEVRPQVSGIILKRNFVEGSDIRAGDSLYQIDPATYQAAYANAKGNLAQAQANAQIAELTVKRYKYLLGTKYISQQDYDTAIAKKNRTAAAVYAAKALVETARINLAYTKVKAPISGHIGKSSITEGSLVQTAQISALATVQQLDPIYVDITQSSEEFLRLRNELNQGKLQQTNGKAKVKLLGSDGKEDLQYGTLEFSDLTVEETTGSITLRAVFPNPERTLLPGMFVRARLDEGTNLNALLVPQRAIIRTPTGQATVMVVSMEDKVEVRNITTDKEICDMYLVTSGLKDGERVVVTGVQHIKPGIIVIPQEISNDNVGRQT